MCKKSKRFDLFQNTHTPGAFYETYIPELAKPLLDRFEFVFTPRHASWLNVAEIDLSVLSRQCLSRRIGCMKIVEQEVYAWLAKRNAKGATINWQFTTENARIKLKSLYPTFDD